VGGEDHSTGQSPSSYDHPYQKLEAYARERWPACQEVVYKWSGQVRDRVFRRLFRSVYVCACVYTHARMCGYVGVRGLDMGGRGGIAFSAVYFAVSLMCEGLQSADRPST
jgi:hypothetical protein